MNVNISGHHVEVTDSMRDYVHAKLERVERHFDHVTNVNVILSVEKLQQKAEASIHTSGNQLFADSVDEDMYAAIDSLTDKLDRLVTKHKEKTRDHRANEGRHAELYAET